MNIQIQKTEIKATSRTLSQKWTVEPAQTIDATNPATIATLVDGFTNSVDSYASAKDEELYDAIKRPLHGSFGQLINWLMLTEYGSVVPFYTSGKASEAKLWCDEHIKSLFVVVEDIYEHSTPDAIKELTKSIIHDALDSNYDPEESAGHFAPNHERKAFERHWFMVKQSLDGATLVPWCYYVFLDSSDAMLFKLTWGGE